MCVLVGAKTWTWNLHLLLTTNPRVRRVIWPFSCLTRDLRPNTALQKKKKHSRLAISIRAMHVCENVPAAGLYHLDFRA